MRIIPNPDHCALFNNKKLSYDYVESIGIPTPKRLRYEEPNEIAKEMKHQSIKKSVVKLLTGNSSKGVFYADCEHSTQELVIELINKFKLKNNRYPQVEERVVGEGFGSSALYWNGEIIAYSSHRRLREKIETGGTSTFRQIVENK